MASHAGRQPTRWSASRRRSGKAVSGPPEPEPAAAGQAADGIPAPETADIYRSLFNDLRHAFGGTVDDANADAIAFAATELFHKDIEPRLWDHKSAQEILDSFGVPRAGAFTRYSLSDRLLLLHRSADPDRSQRAHTLLTDLGVPEQHPDGTPRSLKDRLEWLLDGVGPLSPPTRPDADGGPPGGSDGAPAPGTGGETADGLATEQLTEALVTIREAARTDTNHDTSGAPALSGNPPAAELIGLGTMIASVQDELIRTREAVQTLQTSLDEVLALLRARAGGQGGAVLALAAPPTGELATEAPPLVEEPAVAQEPAVVEELAVVEKGVDPAAGAAAAPVALDQEQPEQPPPAAPVVAIDDVTQPVPIVTDAPVLQSTPPVERRWRRLGVPMLILIAVVVGLLVAGVAIAISMVGWSELSSQLSGVPGHVFSTLLAFGASVDGVAEVLHPHSGVG